MNFQLVFDKFGGLLNGFCGLHSIKPQFSFFIANKKLSRDFICFKKHDKAKTEKHRYRCNLRNNFIKCRSSLWRSSIKETALKDLQYLQENICVRVSFLIPLQAITLLKKILKH